MRHAPAPMSAMRRRCRRPDAGPVRASKGYRVPRMRSSMTRLRLGDLRRCGHAGRLPAKRPKNGRQRDREYGEDQNAPDTALRFGAQSTVQGRGNDEGLDPRARKTLCAVHTWQLGRASETSSHLVRHAVATRPRAITRTVSSWPPKCSATPTPRPHAATRAQVSSNDALLRSRTSPTHVQGDRSARSATRPRASSLVAETYAYPQERSISTAVKYTPADKHRGPSPGSPTASALGSGGLFPQFGCR